jgi:hypothetical protein
LTKEYKLPDAFNQFLVEFIANRPAIKVIKGNIKREYELLTPISTSLTAAIIKLLINHKTHSAKEEKTQKTAVLSAAFKVCFFGVGRVLSTLSK